MKARTLLSALPLTLAELRKTPIIPLSWHNKCNSRSADLTTQTKTDKEETDSGKFTNETCSENELLRVPLASEKGSALTTFIAQELRMGKENLIKWRNKFFTYHNMEGRLFSENCRHKQWWKCREADLIFQKLTPHTFPSQMSQNKVLNTSSDANLLKWAVSEGRCTISPFVVLSRSNKTTASSTSSTFIVTKNLPPGIFLFSIPTKLAIVSTAPSVSDFLLPQFSKKENPVSEEEMSVVEGIEFFRHAEDLALQLASEMADMSETESYTTEEENCHPPQLTLNGYVRHLAEATTPPKNLPFLLKEELYDEAQDPPISHSQQSTVLWDFFHNQQMKQPFNLAMFRKLLMGETEADQRKIAQINITHSLRESCGYYFPQDPFPFSMAKFHRERRETLLSLWGHELIDKGLDSEENAVVSCVISKGDEKNHSSHRSEVIERVAQKMAEMLENVNVLDLSSFLPPLHQASGSAEAGTHDTYLWLISQVLSRRLGENLMVPILDKLNHSVSSSVIDSSNMSTSITPNAHYTMSTDETFCGLDLFDNLLAGVDEELLEEPHVHVFTIQPVSKGDVITISYADGLSGEDDEEDSNAGNTLSSEDKAIWKILWGFVPNSKPPITRAELNEITAMVSQQRLAERFQIFPL